MPVYKIYKKGDEDNYYIGSTNNLKKAKYFIRKSNAKQKRNLCKYIEENGGWDKYIVESIDNTCDYRFMEQLYIKELNPSINKMIDY